MLTDISRSTYVIVVDKMVVVLSVLICWNFCLSANLRSKSVSNVGQSTVGQNTMSAKKASVKNHLTVLCYHCLDACMFSSLFDSFSWLCFYNFQPQFFSFSWSLTFCPQLSLNHYHSISYSVPMCSIHFLLCLTLCIAISVCISLWLPPSYMSK